ncbi:phosphopantetheine-binding protein [Actinacidiphila yeochonensis]|uniref:phosphopantetheine-binding protein n=1 Tax=Actinacidiphila yeochonensis TaxID=89050 RepID=UPI00056B15F5|nr:phosphopantetheine-binding protein [Actinacidiphila yeochonensis]
MSAREPAPGPAWQPGPGAADEVGGRIVAVLREVAADAPGTAACRDVDTALAGLDSLGVVQLMVRLEAEFAIEFSAESVTRVNFTSLAAVRALVDSTAGHRTGRDA